MSSSERADSKLVENERQGIDTMRNEFRGESAPNVDQIIPRIMPEVMAQVSKRWSTLNSMWMTGFIALAAAAGLLVGIFGTVYAVNYLSNEQLVKTLEKRADEMRNETATFRESAMREVDAWRNNSDTQLRDMKELGAATISFVESQRKEFGELRSQFKNELAQITPLLDAVKTDVRSELDRNNKEMDNYRAARAVSDGHISSALILLGQAKDELFSRDAPKSAEGFVLQVRDIIRDLRSSKEIGTSPICDTLERSVVMIDAECALRMLNLEKLTKSVEQIRDLQVEQGKYYVGVVELHQALLQGWQSEPRVTLMNSALVGFNSDEGEGTQRFADVLGAMIALDLGRYEDCILRCEKIEVALLNGNAGFEESMGDRARAKLTLVRCIRDLASFITGEIKSLPVFDCTISPGSVDIWNSALMSQMLDTWIINRDKLIQGETLSDAECLREEAGLYCLYVIGALRKACMGQFGAGCVGCGSAIAANNPNIQDLIEAYQIRATGLWPKLTTLDIRQTQDAQTLVLNRMVSYKREMRKEKAIDGAEREVEYFVPNIEKVTINVPKIDSASSEDIVFSVSPDYWVFDSATNPEKSVLRSSSDIIIKPAASPK